MARSIQGKNGGQSAAIALSDEKRRSHAIANLAIYLQRYEAALDTRLQKHGLRSADAIAQVITIARQSDDLLACDNTSILGAVLQTAQLGLRIDNVLGHAYLVPFARKAQLILGYKGMIYLAEQSGSVSACWGDVVYERDQFAARGGTDPHIEHVRTFDAERGGPVAVYGCIRKTDGFVQPWTLSWSEVQKLQRSAKGKQSPWRTYPGEMGIKTCLRRGFKFCSLTPQIGRVVALDEQAEAGLDQDLDGERELGMEPSADSGPSLRREDEDIDQRPEREPEDTPDDIPPDDVPTPSEDFDPTVDKDGNPV